MTGQDKKAMAVVVVLAGIAAYLSLRPGALDPGPGGTDVILKF